MKKLFSGIAVECVKGDISAQHGITAVVNAANAWLRPGGGVAGAIHRAAGSGLAEECQHLAPVKPGQAVITAGYNLPNEFVIHCLGPVYGHDKPEEKLLADCYRNALLLAEQKKIDSVAFPAISTGIFGYPIKPASKTALKTIIDTIPILKNVRLVRMVLHNDSDLIVFAETLSEFS